MTNANKVMGIAGALALALIAAHLLFFVAEAGPSQFEPMSVDRPR
jgi:hypothetical protein